MRKTKGMGNYVLALASDRVGTGLFVLEYTGPKPGQGAANRE